VTGVLLSPVLGHGLKSFGRHALRFRQEPKPPIAEESMRW
jgi:hypothetical protein